MGSRRQVTCLYAFHVLHSFHMLRGLQVWSGWEGIRLALLWACNLGVLCEACGCEAATTMHPSLNESHRLHAAMWHLLREPVWDALGTDVIHKLRGTVRSHPGGCLRPNVIFYMPTMLHMLHVFRIRHATLLCCVRDI